MPRLTRKGDLLERFEDAVRLSGWSIIYLSSNIHPARYRVYRENQAVTIKVYIWNISHGGGKKRSETEYRIQVTGVTEFEPETNGQTLVLGWWEDVGVFAGWDVRQHAGILGSSPSMQVDERALRQALQTGFAPYTKSNGETAIAFRPDFMGTYIEYLEALHDSGSIPSEAILLTKLSEAPDEVADDDIKDEVAQTRQRAVVETRRALRALDFSKRVLTAYGHRCAMCGIQLRLIDGAHILPVAHADSTDYTSNGVALCALHHRAYDQGLVTFDPAFKLHMSTARLRTLEIGNRADGAKTFRDALRPTLNVPSEKKDQPAVKFVTKANELRGWDF